MLSPSSGANVTDISSVLSGYGSDADRVKIFGDLLTPGVEYVFQLGVANFLKPSNFENDTYAVKKASIPVPELTLSSRIDLKTGEILVSEGLSITARAVVS